VARGERYGSGDRARFHGTRRRRYQGRNARAQAEHHASLLHAGRAHCCPFFERLARALAAAHDLDPTHRPGVATWCSCSEGSSPRRPRTPRGYPLDCVGRSSLTNCTASWSKSTRPACEPPSTLWNGETLMSRLPGTFIGCSSGRSKAHRRSRSRSATALSRRSSRRAPPRLLAKRSRHQRSGPALRRRARTARRAQSGIRNHEPTLQPRNRPSNPPPPGVECTARW